nr:monodehydroascorbate reductase [Tanacetum cinerariifolium]
MRILSVVRIKVFSIYGYDYMKKIVLRRADLNEHVIAKRDFKHMYPSDFEDLYLLNLQGHLNHLPPKDKKILTTAVNQWTRQLVIRQRVEDFQLGIESYQTQVNLTKPQWTATSFDTSMTTPSSSLLGLLSFGINMRVKEFRINRLNPGLNTRFWTRKDVDRCNAFLFAIQRRLRTHRIFRSLESFVGGRDKYGVQMMMRFNEIHEFSDGTLLQINEALITGLRSSGSTEAFEDTEDLSQPRELCWRTRQRGRLQTFEAYRLIKLFRHSRPLSDDLNNRNAHLDYLRHLKESVETIRDIVEEAKVDLTSKGDTKLPIDDQPRKNKSNLRTSTRIDSSSRFKRTIINLHLDSVCQTCAKCLTPFNNDLSVATCLQSAMATPSIHYNRSVEQKVKQVWKPKQVRQVWKPTGKFLTTIGHQWRPTGRIFDLGNQCPLTKFTPPKFVSATQHTKRASPCANQKEPNQNWGSKLLNSLSLSGFKCRSYRSSFDKMADVNAPSDQTQTMAPPDTILYDKKAGCYKCQLDEQWFDLTKETLREALEITPVNRNQEFAAPPSIDRLIDFFNQLGYPKLVMNLSTVVTNDLFQPWRALLTIINLCLMGKTSRFERPRSPMLQILWGIVTRANIDHAKRIWEEFTQSIHTFIEDKWNLSRHTSGKKRATLIVIPSIRFTKLIIHHLQRKHRFHPRPDSPLYLSNKEPVLRYLKFSAKGTKREIFGMPIPGRLITANIREASYYQEYQENVAKHKGFLAGETGSTQDLPVPKLAKPARKPQSTARKAPPKPSILSPVTSTQPATTSVPAKT